MIQLPQKYDYQTFQPLKHASFIELFFDLVFIFCMRSIIPIITDVGEQVDAYSYYAFAFTFFVMLQVWFNSTILTNRFGTGGVLDSTCLVVNMLLLLAMSYSLHAGWQDPSTWTDYTLYNVCWLLINVNLALHWLIRLKLVKNPDRSMVVFVRRVITALLAQVVIIAISLPIVGVAGQVLCAIAFVVGIFAWNVHAEGPLEHANADHLIDRCALLVILTFGEMLIAVAQYYGDAFDEFEVVTFFFLILFMFLVYRNQVNHVVDKAKLGNGFSYISVSAFITFCAGNIAAAFEMFSEETSLMGIDCMLYLEISVCMFLLAFFFLLPVARDFGRIRRRWITARAAACLCLPVLALAYVAIVYTAFGTGDLEMTIVVAFYGYYIAQALNPIAVLVVLLLDRHMLKGEIHW